MDNNTQYKICPNCGNYLSSTVRFCGNCNYIFEQTQYYQQQTMYQQPYMQYYQPQPGPRTVVCEKCGEWYDYARKRCPKCNKVKPHSGLSVAAQILSVIAFFMPLIGILGMLGRMFVIIALILSIIDLAIGDKRKRHTGAYDGIVIFVIYVFLYGFGWIFLFM
jgi:uncharacterized OB-fold protein